MRLPFLLGIADRVTTRGIANPAVPLDILGLRQAHVSHLFPLDLRSFLLVIAFPPNSPPRGKLRFYSHEFPKDEVALEFNIVGRDEPAAWEGQMVLAFPLRNEFFHPILQSPRRMFIEYGQGDVVGDIGQIDFIYAPAPPISDAQRRAIESNPSLQRTIRYAIRCNSCRSGITPQVSLSRPSVFDDQDETRFPGLCWYEDLPDEFRCACGTTIPLRYLRESMHWLLTSSGSLLPDGSLAATSEISLANVEEVLRTFARFLDDEPREQDIQTFIQNHLLLLAPFGARHLFVKPPILNKFRADFGLINSKRELLLIEIERSHLPLLRADGTQTAELTHAFSQPHSWNNEIMDNRSAVLSCIDNCPPDVTNVRYLVIAGRSKPYDPGALTRLIRSSVVPEFMTYDHLIEHVRNATRVAVS